MKKYTTITVVFYYLNEYSTINIKIMKWIDLNLIIIIINN